ncbi:MAG: hypothetical protein ACRDVE_06425 [Actinocrinis sp.]
MADARVLTAGDGVRARLGASVPADTRRRLQLALGALWLLDGVLQLQPYMFTKDFAVMTLAPVAEGNPGWISGPVHWSVTLVQQHPVGTNTAFALVQIALGVGIAWRPALKIALAASIAWACGVWWMGEGLGALLSGDANPLTGAPGAAIIYALLAIVLWPSAREAAFPAAARISARGARGLWVALWGLLAFLALLPANRAADAVEQIVTGTDTGAPAWVIWLDGRAGAVTADRGLEWSLALAILLVLIALSVLSPWRRLLRAGLVGACAVAGVIWVFGEGFGMPFQGMATDPNTGPLLALLAAAYWPARTRSGDPAAQAGAR